VTSMQRAVGADASARRGAAYGLMAAALFGLSAPIAKYLLKEISPQVLAGLLYVGAGIALSVLKALRKSRDTPLQRRDLPALAGIVIAGGVLGPLLMLIGLDRVSPVSGSLLLNLEGPFTIVLAVLLFGEHIGRYGLAAATLIFLGAALLKLQPGLLALDALGAGAIALACLAWAFDNNLTQRLSQRDPVALVRVKTLAAGSFNLAVGLMISRELPSPWLIASALTLGALSYGVSVVLDAYALRLIGAAREAMYFATAPFLGALTATWFFREALSTLQIVSMGIMALGVAVLLRERHAHRHVHQAVEHEHMHTHDEHHAHSHAPGVDTNEPHAHRHQHVELEHDHPHVPDAHHKHRH
jgi:drug/metabolite transporter (DMT)-like permease